MFHCHASEVQVRKKEKLGVAQIRLIGISHLPTILQFPPVPGRVKVPSNNKGLGHLTRNPFSGSVSIFPPCAGSGSELSAEMGKKEKADSENATPHHPLSHPPEKRHWEDGESMSTRGRMMGRSRPGCIICPWYVRKLGSGTIEYLVLLSAPLGR